jgi:hypothetical protein
MNFCHICCIIINLRLHQNKHAMLLLVKMNQSYLVYHDDATG